MDLILIRHGLPQRSAVSADPPLSDTGWDQARRAAAHLAREPIHAVWSSSMQRARQTAQPLAEAAGLSVSTHDGIREYDHTGGEYVPDEVLKAENYEAWLAQARGGHGYDLHAFRDAVVEGMEQIIAAHPSQRVAVFCHGGVINIWTAHVLDMEPRLFFEPTYASISRFACSRGGHRGLVTLNERDHLRD